MPHNMNGILVKFLPSAAKQDHYPRPIEEALRGRSKGNGSAQEVIRSRQISLLFGQTMKKGLAATFDHSSKWRCDEPGDIKRLYNRASAVFCREGYYFE